MKKASFGRRSSAAGRNTFGTFGRQNSFDGNDIRLFIDFVNIKNIQYIFMKQIFQCNVL